MKKEVAKAVLQDAARVEEFVRENPEAGRVQLNWRDLTAKKPAQQCN